MRSYVGVQYINIMLYSIVYFWSFLLILCIFEIFYYKKFFSYVQGAYEN